MRQITPEDMYQAYLQEMLFKSKGIYPRKVKNFDNIKASPDWPKFQRLAFLVNAKDGALDYKIYFKALADHYEGYFPTSEICSMKSFKLYRNKIDIVNSYRAIEKAEESILKSIKFIALYCVENEIQTYEDYLCRNITLMPDLLKHYIAGSISIHFLALLEDVQAQMDCYPKDCVNEFFKQCDVDSARFSRSKMLTNEKWRKISDNLELVMNKAIEQYRKVNQKL